MSFSARVCRGLRRGPELLLRVGASGPQERPPRPGSSLTAVTCALRAARGSGPGAAAARSLRDSTARWAVSRRCSGVTRPHQPRPWSLQTDLFFWRRSGRESGERSEGGKIFKAYRVRGRSASGRYLHESCKFSVRLSFFCSGFWLPECEPSSCTGWNNKKNGWILLEQGHWIRDRPPRSRRCGEGRGGGPGEARSSPSGQGRGIPGKAPGSLHPAAGAGPCHPGRPGRQLRAEGRLARGRPGARWTVSTMTSRGTRGHRGLRVPRTKHHRSREGRREPPPCASCPPSSGAGHAEEGAAGGDPAASLTLSRRPHAPKTRAGSCVRCQVPRGRVTRAGFYFSPWSLLVGPRLVSGRGGGQGGTVPSVGTAFPAFP